MTKQLPLHQEVLLLALSDDKGTFNSGMYLYAVAGAMVSELMLLERIVCNDDKQQTVAVIDDSPTDHVELNELLELIDQAPRNQGLQHWVSAAAGFDGLNHRVAKSLCQEGILKPGERKILFVFSQRTYPEVDGTWEDHIRRRMADVMFHPGTEPDVRTAALIAFAYHADLLKPNFVPEELKQHRFRIKELANGNILAAGATKATIEALQAAIMTAAILPATITSAATR
jgi:hypothetical protein